MPRIKLEPKFCYRQESEPFYKFPFTSNTTDMSTFRNNAKDGTSGIMPFLNSTYNTTTYSPFFFPMVNLPAKGNGHNLRSGNRITVTSIHWKCTLTPTQYLPLNMNHLLNDGPTAMQQVPCNDSFFMKFRYMLVQFDDDLQMTDTSIYQWFKDTFCFCTDPGSLYPAGDPNPVSVHSSVMRLTTPWISKFQILTDRKFIITSKHPQLDIDVTIPIRRQYIFDETATSANVGLITPNIMLFIIGPLNWNTDVDSITRLNYANNYSGTSDSHYLFNANSWTKLNFIDL